MAYGFPEAAGPELLSRALTTHAGISLQTEIVHVHNMLNPLLPDGGFSIGLYGPDGRLIASFGALMLSSALTSAGLTDESAVRVFTESFSAGTDIGIMTFALGVVERNAGRPEIRHLCHVGAAFLARTSALIAVSKLWTQSMNERRAIGDCISQAFLVLDRSGKLNYINGVAKQILKIGSEAPNEARLRDLLGYDPLIERVFEARKAAVDKVAQIDLRRGAVSLRYTAVPVFDDSGEVVSVVDTFREIDVISRVASTGAEFTARSRFEDMLGEDPAFLNALRAGTQASQNYGTILISGDGGTGKTMLAEAIHNASNRSDKPFVVVDCRMLSPQAFRQIFKTPDEDRFERPNDHVHESAFELAAGGSLVLEGIDAMPVGSQIRLLQVLNESAARVASRSNKRSGNSRDFRLISTTTVKLASAVEQHRLHPRLRDLLGERHLAMPSLRERPSDIPLFIRAWTAEHEANEGSMTLPGQVMQRFYSSAWPGNVKQFQHVFAKVVARVRDGSDLSKVLTWMDGLSDLAVASTEPQYSKKQLPLLEEAERGAIRSALQVMDSNVSRTAEALGISRPTLYAKMKKYGVGSDLEMD